MKTSLYSTCLLIFSTVNHIVAKSIYDTEFEFRDDAQLKSYPVKRKVNNYEQPYYGIAHEERASNSDNQNYLNGQSNLRFRRIEDPSVGNPNIYDSKSNLRRVSRHVDRLNQRELDYQSKEPYGFVYRKGRLIGILEPYPDLLYEVSPFSNGREGIEEIQPLPHALTEARSALSMSKLSELEEPSDDSEKDEASQNEYAGYSDDKYPMILADFKINSKLNALNSIKRDNSLLTRDSEKEKKNKHELTGIEGETSSNSKDDSKVIDKKTGITDEKISELSLALNRIQRSDSSDKVEAIEDDLRGILSDMGLIDGGNGLKNKRAVDVNEDENLEQGINKIEVVKATHDPEKTERKKRAEVTETIDTVTHSKLSLESVKALKATETNLPDQNQKAVENIEGKRDTATINVQNYQDEGDAYIRNKRHESSTQNSDIMKGLEKSGDLTVSGNKSPLAILESGSKNTIKRNDVETNTLSNIAASRNDEYEKQLEQNIQKKINAIKEEVKREIAALQAKNAATSKATENAQRRKRETPNTLLEAETKILNPQEQPEGLVPHVRVKRNMDSHQLPKRDLKEIPNDYFSENEENSQDEYENESDEYNGELETTAIAEEVSIKTDNFNNHDSPSTAQLVEINTENHANAEDRHQRDVMSALITETQVQTDSTTSANIGSVSELNTKSDENSTSIPHAVERAAQTERRDIEEGNNVKIPRMRRQVDLSQNQLNIIHTRKKRAGAVVPDGTVAYLPYRAEDDEVDEEGDEFEDDGFDDRTASLQKRATNDDNELDYQNAVEYELPDAYGFDDYEQPQQKYSQQRKYVGKSKSSAYDNSPNFAANNFLYNPAYIRRKRHNFDQLVALHGGGATLHHLQALRERNMRQFQNDARKKRNFNKHLAKITDSKKDVQQNIADLSDTDLFGALPQSYEGELARFKRVKRNASATNEKG